MKNNLVNITLIAASVIFAILYLSKCNEAKEFRSDIQELSEYKDSAKYYKDKQTGQKIAYNKALELSTATQSYLQDQNKVLAKQAQKYQKLASAAVVRSNTSLDSVTITLHDTIPCEFSPITFFEEDKFYTISGRITSQSLFIDNVTMPNEQVITIGKKKGSIFKKKEYEVEVVNSNPYVSVQGIQGYTFTPEKKWYDSKLLWMAAGFFGAKYIIK